MIKLEQFSGEHVEEVLTLIPPFIKENYPDEEFTLQDLRKFLNIVLQEEHRDLILAKEEGKIVGFLSYKILIDTFNSKRLSIIEDGIYINPESRGGRVFIKLLKALEEIARLAVAKRVIIGCPQNQDFEKYSKMYNKLGYSFLEASFSKEM